jgi:hypothetical protein
MQHLQNLGDWMPLYGHRAQSTRSAQPTKSPSRDKKSMLLPG